MEINSTPQMPQVPQTNTTSGKKIGPIVGTLIILILLVAGAIYFWANRLNNGSDTNSPTPTTVRNPANNAAVTQQVRITNKADDLGSISNDLNTTGNVSADATSF